MVQGAINRTTEYLIDTVGNGLRTVVSITPNDYEIHYLRDDLKQQYTQESSDTVVESFRLDQAVFNTGIGKFPVGDRQAIIHHHTHAYVIQFPLTETTQLLISLIPEIGKDLHDFIEHLRNLATPP